MKKYFGITILFSFIVSFLSGFVFKTLSGKHLNFVRELFFKEEWMRKEWLEMEKAHDTFFRLSEIYNYNWTVASFTFGILIVFFFTLSKTIYYDKLMRIFKR